VTLMIFGVGLNPGEQAGETFMLIVKGAIIHFWER
jgi:hypothetical protein